MAYRLAAYPQTRGQGFLCQWGSRSQIAGDNRLFNLLIYLIYQGGFCIYRKH